MNHRRRVTGTIRAATLAVACSAALAFAQVPPPPPMAPAPRPATPSGAELVDRFISAFQEASRATEPASFDSTDLMLAELAGAARTSHEAGTIDDDFARRFGRVLLVAKLMSITDRGGVLQPVFNREFGSFVKDVTGKTFDVSPDGSGQIGMLSDAMATELSRLGVEARRKSR
jgi:hypothetical protein